MTCSVVARDPASGTLGVAIQSRSFALAGRNLWLEPGVGVVTSQASPSGDHGPAILSMLRMGAPAGRALGRGLAADAAPESRQLAVLDATGEVAIHTGAGCIGHASHRSGPGYGMQANLMATAAVCDAMEAAYLSTEGDLLDRLVGALRAAEAEGGDLRGPQGAALVVVPGQRGRHPAARLVDLRVEASAAPLDELARLVGAWRVDAALRRAMMSWGDGDVRSTAGHLAGVDTPEAHLLLAASWFVAGDIDRAVTHREAVRRASAGWGQLAGRAEVQLGFARHPGLVGFLTW